MSNSSSLQPDQIVIGGTYALLSLAELLIYLPCLVVIRTDSELNQHSCFQLMFHLGLFDMVNIAGQTVVGLVTMTGIKIPYLLNKFFGACMGTAWFTYLSFLHLIAANRFVQICCKPQWKILFFGKKATKFWIVLCWLHGSCWFLLFLTPQCTFMYIVSIYTWFFDTSKPLYNFASTLNWVMDLILLKCSLLWYIAIVVSMRITASDMGSSPLQASMRAKERLILRQAVSIGLYTFVWGQYWNIAPWLSAKGFKYAFALGNFFWVTNSGINPIVYLTMNKIVSKKVKRMLKTSEVQESQIYVKTTTGQTQRSKSRSFIDPSSDVASPLVTIYQPRNEKFKEVNQNVQDNVNMESVNFEKLEQKPLVERKSAEFQIEASVIPEYKNAKRNRERKYEFLMSPLPKRSPEPSDEDELCSGDLSYEPTSTVESQLDEQESDVYL